jgi:hypothetical protein
MLWIIKCNPIRDPRVLVHRRACGHSLFFLHLGESDLLAGRCWQTLSKVTIRSWIIKK